MRERWESLTWPMLAVLVVRGVLTIFVKGFAPADPNAPDSAAAVALRMLGLLVWLLALVDGPQRFYADLAGPSAALELGIAKPGWQKILAKTIMSAGYFLIATLAVLALFLASMRPNPDGVEFPLIHTSLRVDALLGFGGLATVASPASAKRMRSSTAPASPSPSLSEPSSHTWRSSST